MRIIDERFLTPHPRTVLWFAQRGKCERCVNSHQDGDRTSGKRTHGGMVGGMRCSAAKDEKSRRATDAYCIDAREEGAKCGPGAKLFKPLKGAVGRLDLR